MGLQEIFDPLTEVLKGIKFGWIELISVVAAWYGLLTLWRWFTGTHRSRVHSEYDYIVVGSSASGCVIANRLVREGGHSVLLLEAGDDDRKHDMTFFISYMHDLVGSAIDYCYPTKSIGGLTEKETHSPFGKVLGGSAAIDEGLYQRPQKHELDHLQKIGVDGWTFNDCLPYFTKSEKSNIQEHNRFHGTEGEASITFPPLRSPIGIYFTDSAARVGIAKRLDSNGAAGTGVSPAQVMIDKKGMRCTPATAFVKTIKSNKLFTLRTQAKVSKVEFEGKRAVGVTWTDCWGRKQTTKCKKEVILAAGVVGSPSILMNSEVCENGTVANNVAVGKNFRDLLTVPIIYQTRKGISYDTKNIHNFQKWLGYKMTGTGDILTPMCDTLMFLNSEDHGVTKSWSEDKVRAAKNSLPNCLMSLQPRGGFKRFEFLKRGVSQKIGWFQEALTVNITPCQKTAPSIDSGFGSIKVNKDGEPELTLCLSPPQTSEDVISRTLPMIKLARAILNTDPVRHLTRELEAIDVTLLKSMKAEEAVDLVYGRKAMLRMRRRGKNIPEDEMADLEKIQKELDTDEYLTNYAKEHAQPFGFPVGTCSMAPLKSKNGTVSPVVSSKTFEVTGVEGIRVADSSILPIPFAAPGVATAMMIGERAAEAILQQ
eukprot:TRINITY_DN822_c2_g2_i1.p1 TRINITY_DN822_c2_g2~~TRINITY_DN822_c2_g2_i1.p1  ORF type:complete len:672 (+),score=139.43 TRINITY_DN822_c2_g2_i1:63-2018(+)